MNKPDESSTNPAGRPEAPPKGWLRPHPNSQPTLFPEPFDDALAYLKVSRGELRRWRDLRWISFDIDTMETLDQPDAWEIAFVRNLARSCLSVRQINEILCGLARPLRYDPEHTAYHFQYGWVIPQPEAPFDVVDREIENWIEHLALEGDTERLRDLVDTIEAALDESSDSEEA